MDGGSRRPEAVDGLCGICPAGCWVRAHREGDRLVGVEALPDHPLGMICTIGRHSPEVVHDPQRLRTPLLVLSAGRRGVHFSAGSACHSGDPEPSRTLLAMGCSPEAAHCSIRLSLGTGQSEADVDEALSRIGEVLQASREAVRFVTCR